jgi:sodium transport system permease protein
LDPAALLPTDPPPHAAALRPAPGRRETALVLGLVLALNLLLGVALLLAGLRVTLLVTQALAFALPPIVAVRLFYLDRRRVLPFRAPAPRHLLAALAGGAGLNHLLTLYGVWQEWVWPQPESWRASIESLLRPSGTLDLAEILVTVAMVPAFCEEILFRGFVQSGLVRQAVRPWAGITATALVFGLFHLDPWRFVMAAALGLFLGWLRQVSGSLWPAILAHAVNNVLTITLYSSGIVSGDRARVSALTVLGAAGLVTLAWLLGRRPAGGPAERVL